MPDWATNGGVKAKRAKKHIGDLAAEIAAFKQRCPYGSFTQDDPNTGEWIFYATVREEPPIEWGPIAGDAIHNLRTSLEVLWKSVYHGGKYRRDSFPFFDSPKELEARFRREKEGRHKRVMDIMKNAKPYKRRDCLLWQLHRLDLEEKHHILLPVGTAVLSMTTDMMAVFRMGYLHRVRHRVSPSFVTRQFEKPVYPVHDRTVLGRAPINPEGPQVDMNPQFAFDIAFGESEVVEGQPIVATLLKFADLVDGLADAFATAGLLS